MTDVLDQLAARLDSLDADPVAAHPYVLDEVHRGLVGELERLAGDVAGNGPGTAAGTAVQR